MPAIITTILATISAFYFPWPATAALAIGAGAFQPLVPLSIGILSDILYWSPAVSTVPFYTLLGALASAVILFVRSRLRAGSIT